MVPQYHGAQQERKPVDAVRKLADAAADAMVAFQVAIRVERGYEMTALDDAREKASALSVMWTKERNRLTPAPILPGDITPDVEADALWRRVHEMGLTLERLTALHEGYKALVDEITIAASEACRAETRS